MSLSRYPSILGAHPGNDGDTIRLAGMHRTFTLAVLDGGPYEHGKVSLIPNASVIQAAHYGDMGRSEVIHDLDFGRAIHVPGFGCLRIVGTTNPDWPRLVPVDGDRFYAEYDGGPGYSNWSIRDRDYDGNVIDWGVKRSATETLFGLKAPQTRAQAYAVASYLSAQAEG